MALKIFSPADHLRRYVASYPHADPVVFLARLCRWAVHLGVDHLEGLGCKSLTEIVHFVTPANRIAVVGIIYNGGTAPRHEYALASLKHPIRDLD